MSAKFTRRLACLQVLDKFVEVKFGEGESIIRAGDIGETFYVLKEGTVRGVTTAARNHRPA